MKIIPTFDEIMHFTPHLFVRPGAAIQPLASNVAKAGSAGALTAPFAKSWSRSCLQLLGFGFTVALLLAAAASARASDPIGIYAYVDKVVFEPSEQAPERVQVWGGFALAKGKADDYEAARAGYLYLTLRKGEEDICRKEWADLKAVAGTGQIVAFGSRHEPKGSIRNADAKPEHPDAHPKGWGLTKVKPRDYAPLNQLMALRAKKSAPNPTPRSAVPK